jgi:hypothetical protein
MQPGNFLHIEDAAGRFPQKHGNPRNPALQQNTGNW